jgi:hypothetical protein
MSSVDVGDAVEVTYTGTTGSTVVVSWIDPDLEPDFEDAAVTETPPGSGRFPYIFQPSRAGTWTARFDETGNDQQVERYYIRAADITGPPPLAVLGDISEQFGSMTVAQQQLANALLRAASKLVRSRFPSIDQQIRDGKLDADVVALGVTNMVLRVLRNPGGLRSETIGPFSRTYDTTAAAGLLVITASEEAMFSPSGVTAPNTAIGTARLRSGLAGCEVNHARRW